MSPPKLPPKLQSWIEARKRHHLSHAHVQMARELGLNPDHLGKIDNHRQQPWKAPLPQFLEHLYRERFGRDQPAAVRSIEDAARAERARREARKAAPRTATTEPRTTAANSAAPESEVEALATAIGDIVRASAEVQRAARSLGIFTGDRDLLTCRTCGLMEDVLASGQLVTYREGRTQRDTGLRFEEPALPNESFTCPLCRSQVTP